MSMPLRHLPVVQNWDCHACSHCCRDLQVAVSEEERQRIEAQGWQDDPDIGDLPRFVKAHWWSRSYVLNHRQDRGCIFLSAENRCRIHERFGHAAKPLACRLYPYALVPTGDHWRISLRYACPSASENRGLPVKDQGKELQQLAEEYEKRQGLTGVLTPPPLQGRQRVEWTDLFRLVKALNAIMSNRANHIERRLRQWLALAALCRQAKLAAIQGDRFGEFLNLVVPILEDDVPTDPATVPAPTWVGRVLFRQLTGIYGRKDHGLLRGDAVRGRLSLLGASWRFARGKGRVPKINRRIGDITFAEVDQRRLTVTADMEQTLERYYLVKLNSLQFCGPTNFGLGFWDGLDSLALTFPLTLWLARASESSAGHAITDALSIVDDHFGTNPLLRQGRYQLAHRLIARRGELPRLIAHYGRHPTTAPIE